MLIAFPLQQWLHEPAWMLLHCCLVANHSGKDEGIQTDSSITTADTMGLTFLCVNVSRTFLIRCLHSKRPVPSTKCTVSSPWGHSERQWNSHAWIPSIICARKKFCGFSDRGRSEEMSRSDEPDAAPASWRQEGEGGRLSPQSGKELLNENQHILQSCSCNTVSCCSLVFISNSFILSWTKYKRTATSVCWDPNFGSEMVWRSPQKFGVRYKHRWATWVWLCFGPSFIQYEPINSETPKALWSKSIMFNFFIYLERTVKLHMLHIP
jgi:hypothetical protein